MPRIFVRYATAVLLAASALTMIFQQSDRPASASPTPGWSAPIVADIARGDITSVSCPAVGTCAAADYYGNAFNLAGGKWTETPADFFDVNADGPTLMSCASSTDCILANPDSTETYDGTAWQAASLFNAPTQVACAPSGFCMELGNAPYPDQYIGIYYTYGGSPQSSGQSPDADATGLSCVSENWCLLTSGTVSQLFDGTGWAISKAMTMSDDGVSCGSTQMCAAINHGGTVSVYNGTSWSTPLQVDNHLGLSAVSCPTVKFCVAVDRDGRYLTYNGVAWATPRKIDAVSGFNSRSVSCASATYCVAVDAAGRSFTWNGFGWTGPLSFDPRAGGDSGYEASCSSPTFCVAVDEWGYGTTFDGTEWSLPEHVGPHLAAVSCTVGDFCAALGADGTASTFDGSTWSSPTDVFGLYTGNLDVSCASSSFCLGVDGLSQDAAFFNGTAWSLDRFG
jgi:hypothetical protein